MTNLHTLNPPGPVSIHAPPEGRDRSKMRVSKIRASFNPRAPGGARWEVGCMPNLSQSVSIHAPPEGRDFMPFLSICSLTSFNPRAPGGARLSGSDWSAMEELVSIHAPPEGRDPPALYSGEAGDGVSIHAPPEGRDDSCFFEHLLID